MQRTGSDPTQRVPAAAGCVNTALPVVGCPIEVYWQAMASWYSGVVLQCDTADRTYEVLYDDGDQKWHVLAQMAWRAKGADVRLTEDVGVPKNFANKRQSDQSVGQNIDNDIHTAVTAFLTQKGGSARISQLGEALRSLRAAVKSAGGLLHWLETSTAAMSSFQVKGKRGSNHLAVRLRSAAVPQPSTAVSVKPKTLPTHREFGRSDSRSVLPKHGSFTKSNSNSPQWQCACGCKNQIEHSNRLFQLQNAVVTSHLLAVAPPPQMAMSAPVVARPAVTTRTAALLTKPQGLLAQGSAILIETAAQARAPAEDPRKRRAAVVPQTAGLANDQIEYRMLSLMGVGGLRLASISLLVKCFAGDPRASEAEAD